MSVVNQQIRSYFGVDGLPLNNGYLYFGGAGQNPETNPITVYWDAALTIVAAQPIRTVGGYASRQGVPANVFVAGDFSSTVRDSKGALVYTVANNVDFLAAGAVAATNVTIADVGAYYTGVEVEAALQEIGASLASLAAGNLPTGAVLDFTGAVSPATAPAGFVFASGRTIGNVASNATERNHADTSALYTLLWNNYGNTELPIQDSTGTPTTRGASAAADFAANKRLPVPDCRGRTRAGLDNMGGSGTISRLTAGGSGITGTTMGAAGGVQTHALSVAELATHTHVQDSHNHTQNSHNHTQNSHNHTQDSHNHTQDSHGHGLTDNSHTHQYNSTNTQVLVTDYYSPSRNVALPSSVQNTGPASANGYTVQNATATNQAATATNQAATATNQAATATNVAVTATNQNTGSNTAHQNTQPTIIFTVIIKL